MTFCKRRVCRASAKDELQTIGRPPSQLGGAGRAADCSQLYALQFYTARCKHSALRAPCSQRFTPESGALRPTLMPEASQKMGKLQTLRISLSGALRCRPRWCARSRRGTRDTSYSLVPPEPGSVPPEPLPVIILSLLPKKF